MIVEQGIDTDGIPYFENLYLDLVVYSNGTIKVDDMDEIEKCITKAGSEKVISYAEKKCSLHWK